MSDLSLGSISSSMAPQVSKEETKLNDMMKNIDVSDPTSMIKLQMEYTRFSTGVGLWSALAKDIKDACSQVIQRS